MAYFKNMNFTLNLSQHDIALYLTQITRQKKLRSPNKKTVLLYKGQVLPNQFELNINRPHQLITLHGLISSAKDNSANLKLKGKLIWQNFIINALLFLSVTAVLFFLSALLFQENALQGIVTLIISTVLTVGLFRNLIGRLKADYKKMSSDLIHLLSVSEVMK
jgi:hypothetical protein